MAQLLWNRARRMVAQLMTRHTAEGFDAGQPLALAFQLLGHTVAFWSGAGELALVRNLEQRIPVHARVVLRRCFRARRCHRLQVQGLAGSTLYFLRIDQAVTPHPNAVIGLRQLGDQIAAAVVGDDHLGELGGKVGCFRDHPDASFRSLGAGDDTANLGC